MKELATAIAGPLVMIGGPICWGWAAKIVASHFIPDDANLVGFLVVLGTISTVGTIYMAIGQAGRPSRD